jgi:hypothetical protein
MRSLSSEGRSKKRNGCLLTASSPSKSSSGGGVGARDGSVEVARDDAGVGWLDETVDDMALAAALEALFLRDLTMLVTMIR